MKNSFISDDEKTITLPVPLNTSVWEVELRCGDFCKIQEDTFTKEDICLDCRKISACYTVGCPPKSLSLHMDNLKLLRDWGDLVFKTREEAKKQTEFLTAANRRIMSNLGFQMEEDGYVKSLNKEIIEVDLLPVLYYMCEFLRTDRLQVKDGFQVMELLQEELKNQTTECRAYRFDLSYETFEHLVRTDKDFPFDYANPFAIRNDKPFPEPDCHPSIKFAVQKVVSQLKNKQSSVPPYTSYDGSTEVMARIKKLIPKKKKYTYQDYEDVKKQCNIEGIFGYEKFIVDQMKL